VRFKVFPTAHILGANIRGMNITSLQDHNHNNNNPNHSLKHQSFPDFKSKLDSQLGRFSCISVYHVAVTHSQL